jgi:antitoxin MazE
LRRRKRSSFDVGSSRNYLHIRISIAMKTRVRTVRGELAVPIPGDVASFMNIESGSEVDVVVEDGKIVVRPVFSPKYSLKELLAKVTDANRHQVVDWGPPSGSEVW